MNARANAQAAIDALATRKRTKLRVVKKTKHARTYVVICPRCVALGREKTEHVVKHARARGCREHLHYIGERARYLRRRESICARERARYRLKRESILEKRKARYRTVAAVHAYAAKYREEHRAENAEYQRTYRAKKNAEWLRFMRSVWTNVPVEVW